MKSHKRLSLERLELRTLMAVDMVSMRALLGSQHAIDDNKAVELNAAEFRTIDGSNNNLINMDQGAADTNVIRFGYPAVYPDGHGDEIETEEMPNARDVSNALNAQAESIFNDRYLTDWIVQWGQFLSHDLDLVENGAANNVLSDGTTGDFSIAVGDPNDPFGTSPIPFNRSNYDPETGTPDLIDSGFGPRPNWREQVNSVTSYVDASNVYGSDAERAAALRTFVDGKLKVSADDLLPLNTDGLQNDDPLALGHELFLAGDIRANEQPGLTAVHVLFVREHNRLADLIKQADDTLNDEAIYQLARRIVGAEMQIITYEQYLSALLGGSAPAAADYDYDETLNASITNTFATALFRFGHSMQSSDIPLVDNAGNTLDTLNLADVFFDPHVLGDNPQNVDLIVKGLASQQAQENDVFLVDEIRNMLFGPAGGGGLDLAALDIQRGRDHGLPDYNSVREFYGLEPVSSFEEITSDAAIQATLEELYGDVDNIDVFVGGIAEDHLDGSSVGPTVSAVVSNQFTRLRDGDRFFYTGDAVLESPLVKNVIDLDNFTLAELIRNNTGLADIQDNVFYDESVLYFEAGDRPARIALVAANDAVSLVDRRTGEVMDSRPIAELSQVILVGSESRRGDNFVVDASVTSLSIAGGILVQGGDGRDVVTVRGRPDDDNVTVSGSQVIANNVLVELDDVERLRLRLGSGDDNVEILDEGDLDITIVDEEDGNHGRGRGGRGGRGRR